MACVRQLWPGLWMSLVAQLVHSRTGTGLNRPVFQQGDWCRLRCPLLFTSAGQSPDERELGLTPARAERELGLTPAALQLSTPVTL